MVAYKLVRRALKAYCGGDAECMHEWAVSNVLQPLQQSELIEIIEGVRPSGPQLTQTIHGIRFPNPVGLAAGFDKNASCWRAAAAIGGFGFAEVGSVLPQPQTGNPRPRMFDLVEDGGLINRMGFNSEGAEAVERRLCPRIGDWPVPLGISLGKNLSTPVCEATRDFIRVINTLYWYPDFFVINASSPNTPSLRSLQTREALDDVLSEVQGRLVKLTHTYGRSVPVPLFVKVAPDLHWRDIEAVVEACVEWDVAGIIGGNTTTSREGLRSPLAGLQGGLSGRPLFPLALRLVRELSQASSGRLTIIGCGGIANASDAWAMLRAGASLVQVLTAWVREDPLLPRTICHGLKRRMRRDCYSTLTEVRMRPAA